MYGQFYELKKSQIFSRIIGLQSFEDFNFSQIHPSKVKRHFRKFCRLRIRLAFVLNFKFQSYSNAQDVIIIYTSGSFKIKKVIKIKITTW